ncbi:MAG TPA: LamG domain-containing protein, partial [Candidatus Paceibacterota bacterium]|nr:LamG domain-containing protein [Candidatus Paceibacterota bacterium]
TLTVLPPEPASWNATDGLVLHMKFDGDTKDASGRNNDGTSVGAPAMVAGLIGQALHYNTDTDTSTYNYVQLGAPADLRFGTDVDFSVAYWVRMPQGALPGDLPVLCSATNSYGNPGLTFAPSYELGGWSFSLNGIAQVYGPDGSINDGNWHHLVHAVNRKGNVVTYLNGVQVDTRSASTLGSVDTTGGVFNIGQDPTGEYAETGEADVDDLGVWRRTLTAYDAYAIHYVGRTHGSSFDSATGATLAIGIVEGKPQISWEGSGTVEQADSLLGPWTSVPGATSPYMVEPVGTGKFFRVKR